INARTTGILPLLNEQTTAVPLYLLHILELTGEPYEVMPGENDLTPQSGPQSFLVLFNQSERPACFDDTIRTGNYRLTADGIEQIDGSARWTPGADFMLQLFCAPEFPSASNLKLCNIFLPYVAYDDHGNLSDEAK